MLTFRHVGPSLNPVGIMLSGKDPAIWKMLHLSVASEGALTAAPLSLVVIVEEKRDTRGDLALLLLSDRYSGIPILPKSCQQGPCY